jgi:uncharacterized repeat protein (TIGR02543 family)
MQTNINGTVYKKIYVRKKPTDDYELYKKAYVDNVQVYSAGNPVTYYADTGKVYTEEVDYEASCLSPKTFTPSKAGWTFIGWREDRTASADVLSKKNMGDAPVTLYAVYRQSVTLSYNGNGNTGGSVSNQTGNRYYNASGDTFNPSFKLKSNGYTKTNYVFTGWDLGAVGKEISLSENLTAYAQWVRYSNPMYWYNGSSYAAGYPTRWTVTAEDVDCDHPEDCEIGKGLDIHNLSGSCDEPWSFQAQATGNTGGNKYMEVVVREVVGYSPAGDGSITSTISINGYVINKAGTHTINVDGLNSVTMYADLSNFEYSQTYFVISSIRFY